MLILLASGASLALLGLLASLHVTPAEAQQQQQQQLRRRAAMGPAWRPRSDAAATPASTA